MNHEDISEIKELKQHIKYLLTMPYKNCRFCSGFSTLDNIDNCTGCGLEKYRILIRRLENYERI